VLDPVLKIKVSVPVRRPSTSRGVRSSGRQSNWATANWATYFDQPGDNIERVLTVANVGKLFDIISFWSMKVV